MIADSADEHELAVFAAVLAIPEVKIKNNL